MYGRNYEGKELHFEASGGLLHSALVMQDQETDSYWSIMTGDALAGEFQGRRLEELPLGEKTTWGEWLKRHPDTLVLSVNGREHIENNPYDNYFSSDSVFGGGKAKDHRMPGKAPIFSFQLEGRAYAVPFDQIEGGAVFDIGGRKIFLYRPPGAAIFYSTVAFEAGGKGFKKRGGQWREASTGARFDPESRGFVPADAVKLLPGFDTFWYMWSETHPDTEVLRKK